MFDKTKPDGTPQKLLDVSKLSELGWRTIIPIEVGIRNSDADFLSHYDSLRTRDAQINPKKATSSSSNFRCEEIEARGFPERT